MTVIGKDLNGYDIVMCDTCLKKMYCGSGYIGHFEQGVTTHKCIECCKKDRHMMPPITPEKYTYENLGEYGKDWCLLND